MRGFAGSVLSCPERQGLEEATRSSNKEKSITRCARNDELAAGQMKAGRETAG
jgi:hypothetical protein